MIYVNTLGTSNKFWIYESNSNTHVTIKWGRIGSIGQSQIKQFYNKYKMDSFIETKVAEKINEGYKQVSDDEFAIHTKIAEAIGTGVKIDRVFFVEERGNWLNKLDGKKLHDPNIKPLLYVRIVGRKTANADTPIVNMLINVDDAFVLNNSECEIFNFKLDNFESLKFTNKVPITINSEYYKLFQSISSKIGIFM